MLGWGERVGGDLGDEESTNTLMVGRYLGRVSAARTRSSIRELRKFGGKVDPHMEM